MKANPLNMISFSPTVSTETRIAVMEAAQWLFDEGKLVPTRVSVSKELGHMLGRYCPFDGEIALSVEAVKTGKTEGIQFLTIHELIHAYQFSQSPYMFSRANYVMPGSCAASFTAYVMQPCEREANWWAARFAYERYNLEAACVAQYITNGAVEFEEFRHKSDV